MAHALCNYNVQVVSGPCCHANLASHTSFNSVDVFLYLSEPFILSVAVMLFCTKVRVLVLV